jgi:Ca2+/Na+ antiporter
MSSETTEFTDRLESLHQEIAQYRTDINKQISALYSPAPGLSKLDLKNDPRCAVQVWSIHRFVILMLMLILLMLMLMLMFVFDNIILYVYILFYSIIWYIICYVLEQMLQNEVKELIKESKAFSKDIVDKDSQLNECEQLVSLISCVASASDSVVLVEERIGGADLAGCLAAMAAMSVSLDLLPAKQSSAGDGAVCKTLRREGGMLRSRFHTRLRRLFQQCVVVERGHILVFKELTDVVRDEGALLESPIALKDILGTLLKVHCAFLCRRLFVRNEYH